MPHPSSAAARQRDLTAQMSKWMEDPQVDGVPADWEEAFKTFERRWLTQKTVRELSRNGLGRTSGCGMPGECTMPTMKTVFFMLKRMAPGGDLKHFQFYDVGFMMGKVMALAIAMGAYVARGCELQETEGLQDAVAAMWGEKVVMMPYPTLWDTQFGVPIQDERAELYACPRARGIPGMPEQVVSAWSFDVGFPDDARLALYIKVGACPRTVILMTCKPQGKEAMFKEPADVLATLVESAAKGGKRKTWVYLGFLSLRMSGSQEVKRGWVFVDTQSPVPINLDWVAA